MAVELAFFAHLDKSALYSRAGFAVPYTLPTLIQGDTVVLSVGLVRDNESGSEGQLSQITVAGYSCKVAIGTEGSTPETSATLSPNSDDTLLTGSLPLNTTAIDDLFTGVETQTIQKTFELEFTDSTGVLTIKRKVALQYGLITSALVPTPSPDTALGKAEAANLYIKKAGSNGFVLLDQSGGGNDLYIWNDNGTLRSDPLS